MSTKIMSFFPFLLFSFIWSSQAKVFISEKENQYSLLHQTSDVLSDLSWKAGFSVPKGRVRRDTGDGDGPSPDINTKTFDDTKHNHAILHWSGHDNSSVMFMLTRQVNDFKVVSSTLFRSSDNGHNYQPVVIDGNPIISYFRVSPLNPDILLFVDVGNRAIYKTEDEGKTKPVKCGGALSIIPDKLAFSPYDQNQVLVYSFNNRTVLVSSNLGESWKLLSKGVNSRVFWGIKDLDPPGTVHMEIEDLATDGYRYKKFSPPYDDDGVDQIGVIDMDSLYVNNKYIFVQKSTEFTSHLYVSYRREPFKKAYFPLNQTPLDFRLISADESQVFIAANHHAGHVSLYLSDVTGQYYTESLTDIQAVQFSPGFSADIYEVKGLNGIFIANQKTTDSPKTYITFDQGGNWTLISQPVDKDGQPYDCNKGGSGKLKRPCNLHLHLTTSSMYYDIPSPTSETNAPGIITAQGTVGESLSELESKLFISRDGGMSWQYAHDGDFLVNVLDQGGAIVAVNISAVNDMSKSIFFSTNEGQDWQEFDFNETPIKVDGVLNEPGITTLVTSIYGHLNGTGWIVIQVDFSPVLTTPCAEADYETWSPTDESDRSCLLGQTITYKRQKRGKVCFNGKDYTKQLGAPANCTPCMQEDFECDYGFGRNKNSECTALGWYDASQPIGSCQMGGKYSKSSGYRKVASNKCYGGPLPDQYKATETDCPVLAPASLYLSVEQGNTVARYSEVTFKLQQDEGTKTGTVYTWNFNEGTPEEVTNFSGTKTHTFNTKGVKIVTVTAKNAKGEAVTSVRLLVEDEIRGVIVEGPHGVEVGVVTKFDVGDVVVSNFIYERTDPNVHYMWDFGDNGVTGHKPLLTYDRTVDHVYTAAGNYTCSVTAANVLGTRVTAFPISVYGILVTVQLTFSIETYFLSQGTPIWNNQFADYVKQAVMTLLDLPHTRLEVRTGSFDTPGLYVDVSILPPSQTIMYDPNLTPLARTLVDHVNKHGLKIDLDENDYGRDEEVTAVKAVILKQEKVSGDDKNNLTPLYVCLPIAIVMTILVIGLVVFYYKRKKQLLGNRYRLLRSSSQRPDDTGTGLLDDDDVNNLDDDDDPIIDPSHNPESPNRLTIDGDDPLNVLSSRRDP